MKIRTDQNPSLDALLGLQEGGVSSAEGDAQAFQAALSERLEAGTAQAGKSVPSMPGGAQTELISQILLGAGEDGGGSALSAKAAQAAFHEATGALDMWDDYVQTLGSSRRESLRDAYALLDSISSKLGELKRNAAAVEARMPGFGDLVNRLDVLAASERFKFNRGDYV